ncbi:MAG: LapA family protein [Deltaproteobacteria bacterium]|nr:LapA family protein [Deltaproteobacteria bacterium]
MKTSTIVLLVVLALVAAFIGLFGWQNLATRIDLILDLGPIGGWYIARGFPVPYLMGIMFSTGFLLAFLWFGGRSMTAGRRAKAAERQVAALQDELSWSKKSGGSKSAGPSVRKPVVLEKKAPRVPSAPPVKKDVPAAADPPDFDDLI